ncbi:sigma factor-like helix-turn-helix DNA-binding protein [Prescottella equi]|uniref:RNA polymerase subunit sigma-70 n=1 Tax=Rhodococcus hoagii TaxID=43767 RepID=A0AAE5IMD4_RHOHA|nr:sigma factor-like helix-turn-helix DNA-binding protein [Prescottella equi]ERN47337.1 sigma-70 factor [Prescottella equi NBRC 101255 = C 7]MBM4626980.1 RNA polymerase subunit sigma-70 [Prescottella equi]NKZ77903.1 RNA polymerase subunit sigma-70 [Prescottella equi]ORL09010.1 RNA polymerase subunit sigma-70 [Prescottella equi]ORL24712.1 RNA polymerase subunit sigma-70 [Prescottella equi]
MTSRTRIPRAELPGIYGAVVKRMSRRMLGDVAEPVEVTWHNRTTPDVADDVELAENVSIAMLTVLETLGPVERAVFVLHQVFEMPYAEIAEAVGRTPASVRQIAHRAREHVGARRPRMQVDRAQQQAVVEKFLAAVSTGDVQALVDVLAPDVVVVADGGGIATAAREPIVGARRVAVFLSKAASLPGFATTTTWLNGMPGIRIDVDGEATAVSVVVEDGRITRVYAIRNPHKLGSLDSVWNLRR